MNVPDIIRKLPETINKDAIDGMACTVQLHISEPLIVKIEDDICTIENGITEDADVTLTISDTHLIKLLTGEMGTAMAYMTGKVKVDGDIMLAKEFAGFFDVSKIL